MNEPRKPKAYVLNEELSDTQSKSIGTKTTRSNEPKVVQPSDIIFDDTLDKLFDDNLDQAISIESNRWGIFRWFSAALAALFSLIIGLGFEQMITDLYARNIWVGRIGLGIVIFLSIMLVILIVREWLALKRLKNLSDLRERIIKQYATSTLKEAQSLGDDVIAVYASRSDLNSGLEKLKNHKSDIMDGPEYLNVVERAIMSPLDEKAQALIAQSAKRVSVVTAVNPRAFIDMLFVGFEALRLIRSLGNLYGGKSHNVAMWRLMRHAFSNLAISGGLALTDGLASQLFGHGLASKLSAKFGEGVLNGLLLVRLGLSAQAVLRPMPYNALETPKAANFLINIWKSNDKSK